MKRFSPVVCAVSLFVATTALAAGGPATKPVTAVLSGTATPALLADTDTNGQCNIAPWVDVCPSGTCACFEVSSPKATLNVGKGKQVVTNFFITVDTGINPATEPAVSVDVPNPKCNPVYAVATLASSATFQTETLNFLGTMCKHVIGISAMNPGGKHDKDVLSGGWGISNSPAPAPSDESGWGTYTGTVIQSTQALSIRLSGDLSK